MELTDFEKANYLKYALVCYTTNDLYGIQDYNKYHKYFINKAIYVPYLPVILSRCLDVRQIFGSYQEKSRKKQQRK